MITAPDPEMGKYWVYEDTGANCWGFYVFDNDDNFMCEISDFKSEAEADWNAFVLLCAYESYRPVYQGYSIEKDPIFKEYWCVKWFDWQGNVDHTDSVFLHLNAAQQHAEYLWYINQKRMDDLPASYKDSVQTDLLFQMTQSLMSLRRGSSYEDFKIPTFDEAWSTGIRKFLPDFDFPLQVE